jgi:hypothetical protein
MAEHRLWLHPQSHMPANHYAAPRVVGVIYLLKKCPEQVSPLGSEGSQPSR